MKAPLRVVVTFYAFVSVLVLGASITTPASSLLPGLVMMWFMAGVYTLGWTSRFYVRWPKLRLAALRNGLALEKAGPLFAVTALIVVLSVLRIEFYTGKSIPQVLADLRSGTSLYVQYQSHFREVELATLDVAKIPFVLAGALVKGALLAMVLMVITLQLNAGKLRYVLTGVATLGYLLFSVARGTTFEFFEVILLLLLAVTLRRKIHPIPRTRRIRAWLGLAAGVAVALAIFNYNITSRVDVRCITSEVCVDPAGILYSVSPGLGTLSVSLFAYFGFGTLFMSTFVTHVVFHSLESFLYALSPIFALWIGATAVRPVVCGVHMDCGAAWAPDMAALTLWVGLIGAVVAVFALARLTKHCYRRFLTERSALTGVLLYMLILLAISLPVGNFVTISSANWIVFVVVLVRYLAVTAGPADRPNMAPRPARRAKWIDQHRG